MGHDWNYLDDDPERGPRKWAHKYPGVGQAQSPIDIQIDYNDLRRHQQQVKCTCDKIEPPFQAKANNKQQLDQTDHQHQHHHHHHRHHHNSHQTDHRRALAKGRLAAAAGSRRNHLDSTGGEVEAEESGGEELTATTTTTVSTAAQMLERSGSNSSSTLSISSNPPPSSKRQVAGLAQGGRQRTKYCATNKKLFLGYPRYLNSIKLCNTGHGWQLEVPGELGEHTLLCGPPLGEREYRLAQMHCHWGSNCDQGSEHLVNGRAYSAELHFVHWNCKQFKSLDEASCHKHGLAVLAVFVQALEAEVVEDEGRHCNKHLEKIVSALPAISERANSWVQLDDIRLDLKKLFPSNRWLYASYEGSLTTPPLSEVVDWIVFLQPITCSERQLKAFRQLSCSSMNPATGGGGGEKLSKNCRPIQAINDRLVNIWTHTGNHHHHHHQ